MTPELFFTLCAAFVGLFVGSFLNVAIDLGAAGRSVVWPPSACDACGHRLGALELIPVLSWTMLRAKCRHCGVRLSVQYPAVEILTALLYGVLALRFGPTPDFLFLLVLTSLFLVASGIDLKTRILPDAITLPAAAMALAWASWRGDAMDAFLGAVLGTGVFWLIAWGYEKRTGTEGLGLGDVKLMLPIGAMAGVLKLPLVILGASLAALAAFGVLALMDRNLREGRLPLGPFLAAAAYVDWCWGDDNLKKSRSGCRRCAVPTGTSCFFRFQELDRETPLPLECLERSRLRECPFVGHGAGRKCKNPGGSLRRGFAFQTEGGRPLTQARRAQETYPSTQV